MLTTARLLPHYYFILFMLVTYSIAVINCGNHHHIIISGFGIYGAAVVPDSGVGRNGNVIDSSY